MSGFNCLLHGDKLALRRRAENVLVSVCLRFLALFQNLVCCLLPIGGVTNNVRYASNGLYAQLHYFLNLSQLLVSCLPLLAKLINSGVSDYCCHDY